MSQKGTVAFIEETVFHQLLDYYEERGSFEQALEVAGHATSQYPYTAAFHTRKARILIAMDRIEAARNVLQQVETLTPGHVDIALLSAEIHCASGKIDVALSLLNQIKNKNLPDKSELYLFESFLFEHQLNFFSMFDSLKQALTLDPNNAYALDKLRLCVELSGMYEESIEFHEQLLDENPYSAQAWFNLGQAYLCLEDYENAVEAFEFVLVIEEKYPTASGDCGFAYEQLGNIEKALRYYLAASKLDKDDDELLTGIGRCYLLLGHTASARKYIGKALALNPANHEAHYLESEIWACRGDWHRAVLSCSKAIELEPRREEYLTALAKAWQHLGNSDKAEHYYLQAVETAPEMNQCWIELALFYAEAGRHHDALNTLDDADLFSFGSELRYCRAACLFKAGYCEAAFVALEAALEEEFDNHPVLFRWMPSLRENKQVKNLITSLDVFRL